MTLLAQIHEESREKRERLRLAVRERLRVALRALVPATEIIVFGSLTRPYGFGKCSDIDLAFSSAPSGMSVFRLQAEIEERVERPVDLVELPACRFSAKIEREGERWIAWVSNC